MGALQYKQELALAKAQHIDITEFEDRLLDFKGDFGANVERAGKHFTDAITAIDKSIDQTQKTKNSLLASLKQLETANKKVEKVTV